MISVLAPFPALAKNLHLKYEAYWGGIHIADFTLSLTRDGEKFQNKFHLESRGLTRYFTHLSAIAISKGRVFIPPAQAWENGTVAYDSVENAASSPQAETYIADTYHTRYTNKRHIRWVDIQFGAPGKAAKAVTGTEPAPGREERWNPKEKGPEVLEKVPPEFRTGVQDPISLIPQMIAIIRNHLHGGPPSGILKGFDGRRRFDMDIQFMGRVQRTVSGIRHDAYQVRLVPNPVSGFKNRHKTLWNNAAYDFYFSRDGDFVPLQIVPVNHGPVLTMIKRCKTDCEIKATED